MRLVPLLLDMAIFARAFFCFAICSAIVRSNSFFCTTSTCFCFCLTSRSSLAMIDLPMVSPQELHRAEDLAVLLVNAILIQMPFKKKVYVWLEKDTVPRFGNEPLRQERQCFSWSMVAIMSSKLFESLRAPSSKSVVLKCLARSVTVIIPTIFPPSIIGSRRILWLTIL